MKFFKVWTEVEEIDEDADSYLAACEPLEMGKFNTLEEAEAHRDALDISNQALLKAAENALKVFHMDSMMEQDFSPEIQELTAAIEAARS